MHFLAVKLKPEVPEGIIYYYFQRLLAFEDLRSEAVFSL
jgi:hypothetical protein